MFHYNYSDSPKFSVSGISTSSTIAKIGSRLFTDRSYTISSMPDKLIGSTLFQSGHYVNRATITVSSTVDAYIMVALYEKRDGGLINVLSSEGWTLIDGNVKWTAMLNKIYIKHIAAGNSVTFTTTKNRMTFAIFAFQGTIFKEAL